MKVKSQSEVVQSCPTLSDPHGLQPSRLLRPWDFLGKNTGVGCHFLFQCMKVKIESEFAQLCPTLSDPHGLQLTRLLHPWDLLGKSTGVGCHGLLWLVTSRTPPVCYSFCTKIYVEGSPYMKLGFGGFSFWTLKLLLEVSKIGV